MKSKILVPVDGSDGSLRAVKYAAELGKRLVDPELHLVNVQPPGDDWMVRRMIKAQELEKMEREWCETALAPARALLAKAGVKAEEHFAQGDVAKTVVQLAKDLGCTQIVMGTRGLSALGDLLMGSVAVKVLHHAHVPVTFVK